MGNYKEIVFEIKDTLCVIRDIEKKIILTIYPNGKWTFSDSQITEFSSDRCGGNDFFSFIKAAISRCQEDSQSDTR